MKKKNLLMYVGFCLLMVLSVVKISAATIGADKTFKSGSYAGAYCNTTARVTCPTTSTFKWSTSVSDDRKATLEYVVYRLGDSWDVNDLTKTATYNWRYTVSKLPTGASGGSTTVGGNTGKAVFTYDSASQKLSVK